MFVSNISRRRTRHRFTFFRTMAILFVLACSTLPLMADPIVLKEITTQIDGKTRREALLKELLIHENQEFQSYTQLDSLIRARLKTLMRRRLFMDAEWDLHLEDSNSAVLDLKVTDSFTLYPRPLIRFSSSKGITLGLKLEYLNAFGTLTDNVVEAYWSPGEILLELQVNRIILGPMHLDTSFRQFDGTTRLGNQAGGTELEYRYKESYVATALEIPLGRRSNWKYQVKPSVSMLYDYRFVDNRTGLPDSSFDNSGFTPALEHGITFDNVEWKANFRRGLSFSLLNSNRWYTGSERGRQLLDLNSSGFLPITSWWETSGRLGAFYAFGDIRTDAGDRIRGVLDYMTYGQWGVYLNLQTNFKLFRIKNLFELQIGPFADIAYVLSDQWGYTNAGWETGIGFSSLVYVIPLPSLVINVDFGWDLKRDTPEITIETRQFF